MRNPLGIWGSLKEVMNDRGSEDLKINLRMIFGRWVLKITPWTLVLIGIILGLIIGSVITSLNLRGAAAEMTSYKTATYYTSETLTKAVTHTTPASRLSSCVVFRTLKDHFKVNEPVKFRLINNCDGDLLLPNSAPWIIKNSRGVIIFSPISLQVITRIKPGCFREWSWNQKNDRGKNVEPGIYYIEIKTLSQGTLKLSIKIMD